MFSRLSNGLFQSSKALPRRLFSSRTRSIQIIGLGSALGISAVCSANVLLAQSGGCSDDQFLPAQALKALDRAKRDLEQTKTQLSKLTDLLAGKENTTVSIPKAVKNTAFVFIKPHAVTDAVADLVAETFQAKGVTIVSSGTMTGEQIDDKMYIDQHYYSIASKATILKPDQLNVPVEKFKKKFGLEWNDALAQNAVYNAKDACENLGIDAAELNTLWARCKKEGNLVKFGGGFYCGLIDTVPGKAPIYVFNGFFMAMRGKYVAPGSKLKYFVVEWDAKQMSWEDFRGELLGPTDPADAPLDSLRGLVYKNWSSLGLAYQPNIGDNSIHASASPFEALAERMNWLEADLKSDPYGKLFLEAGIPEKVIMEWSVDPQVIYGAKALAIKMSLFDSLEDTDSDMCLARAIMISKGTS